MADTTPHLYNVVGRRRTWYILSTLLIIPGIFALAKWHLNIGIDFRGGTLQDLHYVAARPQIDDIRKEVDSTGTKAATVQTSGDQDILVRFPNQEGKTPRDTGNAILSALKTDNQQLNEVGFQNIGESVAKSSINKAIEAVIITSLAIILFIAFSFRGVARPASPWRFGITAILALAHDILFVVGAFALIGHFFPSVEVDALFITALLTILGFSVNDTIVVFDRIRENLRRSPGQTFEQVANASLNQTLVRSVNTSSTVLIVLISLLILGGGSIRNFILALTLGVAIGTYSSIFNATPLLVSWQNMADRGIPTTPIKRR
jgi:preprotein translocase subunit SecF